METTDTMARGTGKCDQRWGACVLAASVEHNAPIADSARRRALAKPTYAQRGAIRKQGLAQERAWEGKRNGTEPGLRE
eukprot:6115373-Alexandrium_andersonii.AAC.1